MTKFVGLVGWKIAAVASLCIILALDVSMSENTGNVLYFRKYPEINFAFN